MIGRKRVYGGRAVVKVPAKRMKRRNDNVLRSTGSELKYVDYTLVTTLASTTSNIYTLNFLALGTDVVNRIGRKINVKSVQIKARFVPSGAAAINDNVRLLVIYDRQGYQGAVTFADFIKNTDSAGLTSSTVYDFKNLDNEHRFKVLMDQSYTFPQNGATMSSSDYTDFTKGTMVDKYIKINADCSFGAGSNLPDTGAIYFCVAGQQAAASAPTSVQWTSRVRYTDN